MASAERRKMAPRWIAGRALYPVEPREAARHALPALRSPLAHATHLVTSPCAPSHHRDRLTHSRG